MKKLFAIIVLGLLFSGNAYALTKCEGKNYKKWKNCFGSYTNEAGRKYTGEFGNVPGIRHGEGISVFKERKFEGTFKNDKGISGKLTYSNGDSFEGTFNEKGNFEGKGKFTFQDGSLVVGTWIDHKLYGKGTTEDSNGNKRNVMFKGEKIIN